MTNYTYQYDLDDNVKLGNVVAIDTEAMGLQITRDRLCVIQLSTGDGNAHLVHFPTNKYDASPNLCKLLNDPDVTKLFHFARFDLAILTHYLKVRINNIYCTKIASRLARTYTDHHGLKDLCSELLKVNISKGQQSSNWGRAELTESQIKYAANDVLYLHQLREHLDQMLVQESRMKLLDKSFKVLLSIVELDLQGWSSINIFEH
jgi:ribonuclease D